MVKQDSLSSFYRNWVSKNLRTQFVTIKANEWRNQGSSSYLLFSSSVVFLSRGLMFQDKYSAEDLVDRVNCLFSENWGKKKIKNFRIYPKHKTTLFNLALSKRWLAAVYTSLILHFYHFPALNRCLSLTHFSTFT